MLTNLEYGVLPGHALVMLERIIKDIYMPMADPDSSSPVEQYRGGNEPVAMSQTSQPTENAPAKVEEVSDSVRNEFSSNMHKFVSSISHAIQQVHNTLSHMHTRARA